MLKTNYILFLVLLTTNSIANEFSKVMSLEGKWKFQIGDRKEWANPEFDDAGWDLISVPKPWEDEGYYGYDGFAWYRKAFYLDQNVYSGGLYLFLGCIDDVDEVYINGYLIGSSGSFPPGYSTAYDAFRKYSIPENCLSPNGKNVISVRVYDAQLGGGIVSGEIGIFLDRNFVKLDIDLHGQWKFITKDSPEFINPGYDDSNWSKLLVPGFWENQGYRNYDGFAWYRKSFFVDRNMSNRKMVLMLGKIDDFDEVFINGINISCITYNGFKTNKIQSKYGYDDFRIYYIKENILIPGENNIISVRVSDRGGEGGFYEGPIGFMDQLKFVKEQRSKKGKNY